MLAATAAGLAGAGGLAWLWRREQALAGDRRERLFDRCRGLLEAPALERRRPDYPVLRGSWRGLPAELRPITDAVTARKLPALWLQVSLPAPTGASGILDALLRPSGNEFWAPELAATLPTPGGLPPSLRVRAEGAAARLLPALERRAAFLHRPDAKEVLIAPRGVRLTVLLAEGERSSYLLLRQARFSVDRMDADRAEALLDEAHALHGDVLGLTRRAAA